MNSQLRPLIIIILVLGAVVYVGGIVWAGIASLSSTSTTPLSIPEPITNIVTGIGATLATYFGAILGISEFQGAEETRSAKQTAQSPTTPRPIAYEVNQWSWDAVLPTSPPSHRFYRIIQIVAAYLYFASLLLAGIFWIITLAKHGIPADIIKNMGSALVGVIVGVVSVAMNTR